MRKHYLALGASAVLALALTACSGDDADRSSGASTAATVSHIHGVGIDPADDRLYVATHEGVYSPGQDGTLRLVGDSRSDYMGFMVAGARTFLASGHPSADGDGPGNQGLIESTDAGKTWKAKSLAGEADFHALDHVDGTVFGYDSTSGRVRVSANGVDWAERATIAALDIAVDPDDSQVVLATTEGGVAKSTDGARTFAKGAEPVLWYVSWAEGDGLYGVDGSGAVHRSTDSGSTWTNVGTVPGGRPQALTAVDANRVVVATRDGVYESKDAGRTFAKRLDVTSTGGH